MDHGVGSNERSPWRQSASLPLHDRLVFLFLAFSTGCSDYHASDRLLLVGELEKATPLRSKPRKTHSRHTSLTYLLGSLALLARFIAYIVALFPLGAGGRLTGGFQSPARTPRTQDATVTKQREHRDGEEKYIEGERAVSRCLTWIAPAVIIG